MEAKDIFKKRSRPTEVEQQFILEILQHNASLIKQYQSNTIERFRLVDSGNLKRNRSVEINKSGSFGAEIVHRFPIYMRFLDMKTIRRGGKKVKKKSYWTYNKIIHSRFNHIIWQTQVSLTDETIKRIARELNITIPV